MEKPSRFNEHLTLIANIAVVIGIAFLALELQQNTKAIEGQTRQELANSSRDVILTIAANPPVARAYTSMYLPVWGLSDPTLTAADSAQGKWAMFANLRNLENVWLQVQEGVVGQSALDTYAFTGAMYETAAFRGMWARMWSTAFDPSFVQAFEEANGF